jgi:hypothetical protein
MTTIGGFSLEDAQQIHRLVLGKSAVQKPSTGKSTVFNRAYYARLTADLPAATDPLTGYTQAEATVLRYLDTSVDSLDMEETTETIIVTNRSASYSASENDVIQIDRLGSEWAPKHASGGSNSPGDECPCFCVEKGNLSVNGVSAVVQYTVSLPTLLWKSEYGTISLPAGEYTISWVPARQLWVLDIGDSLVATFNDGSDATNLTTMDGEITLSFPSSPAGTGDCCIDAELNVCVDGIVPQPEGNVGVVTGFKYGYENGYIDGYANAAYDDRVIFTGPTGTGAGTGQYQQFGTGTYLAPGTGTYGENTGTGTGTGTFMWSDYEEGFYNGYKRGYYAGYADGQTELGTGTAPGTGTSPGAGTGVGGP